jgi:tetratricopeptide (TPR) repeat protein
VLIITSYRLIHSISNFIYFGAAAAGLTWIAWTYGRLNPVFVSIVGLAALYLLAALFSIFVLMPVARADFASANFSSTTHKLIRLCALLLPVPVLAYCSYFQYCLSSYDGSEAANSRLERLAHLERSLFLDSVVYDFCPYDDRLCYSLSSEDYTPYFQHLLHNVALCLQFPKVSRELFVSAKFALSSDGSVSNLRISKKSADNILDRYLLDAVRRAVPFRSFPKDTTEKCKQVELSFSYQLGSLPGDDLFRDGPASDSDVHVVECEIMFYPNLAHAVELNNRAVKQINDGDYADAVANLNEILKSDPYHRRTLEKLDIAYYNWLLRYWEKEDYRKALPLFKKVLQCHDKLGGCDDARQIWLLKAYSTALSATGHKRQAHVISIRLERLKQAFAKKAPASVLASQSAFP